MDNIFIGITVRRFLELLLTCVIISVLITFLNVADILVTDITLGIGLLAGFLLYFIENIRMMRGCYRDLDRDMEYAVGNITAYLMFAAVSLIIYFFASNECFVWMFAVTKFVKFIGIKVDTLASLLLFHAIGFLAIFIAPVGLHHRSDEIEFFEDEE